MEMPKQATIDNAIKLLGEAALPGASLLIDGKIGIGGLHLIAGAWAKAAIGPVGAAIVMANSYSESVTGKNLLKHLSELSQDISAAIPKREPGA